MTDSPSKEEIAYQAELKALERVDDSDVYDELHKATIRHLTALVKSGKATAQDVANARQILKDNGISSLSAHKGSPIRKLEEGMPFVSPEAG